jgi:hypothetical protein
MKYLKRFNEELNPSTYRRASKKLLDKGHLRRAEELKKWSNVVEDVDKKKRWSEAVNDFSKFGTYQIDVKYGNLEFTGDFHLCLVLDRDAFADNFLPGDEGGSFWISIICIPIDEEMYNKCISNGLDMYNGGFWSGSIFINFTVGDEIEIRGFELGDYDDASMVISNRKSANTFRKLLIDLFSNSELGYPSSYTDLEDFWELINGYFGANIGLFTDYGFEPYIISDFFKNNTSVNDFFKN